MTTTCQDCGTTWGGLRAEHCTAPGCHQTFTGTRAGDKHRVGAFWPPGERRCLTPDEMRAKGMTQTSRGVCAAGGVSPWAASTTGDDAFARQEEGR